jgi:hypothetical protein
MPQGFSCGEFEQFVEFLDEQLLESSHDMIADFHDELEKVNSPEEGIEANYNFSFRLVEYGRQRVLALQKLGYFDVLTSDKEPTESDQVAIRTAFELGFAVGQHRLMVNYEDYLYDGIAMSEWRDAGLPKARQERLRQGARTRSEIISAAQRLYANDPLLIRNDLETARQILRMRLPALQKGNGQQLGLDAITRHLREARRQQSN